ncbi:alpha/beta fold hydrolase [Tomitella gaofuii]|uniref:alpha/beta fold hydrolase n=1 Tax=Tomitella gaofuii TaxID=2760083 RepID=UPI0015F96CC2|nr:alpha/beta hydrolase [Tomitella gaofuii]
MLATNPSIWTALLGTDFTVRHVAVGGWSTRILEAGSAPQAVVMLPGTGGHLEFCARNVAALAENYRVIALDYPGHGYTTHTTRGLELADYVEHLRALLDVLGIDRAHLNGESLGGWIAVKFAVAHPERVDKLVLNTPGGAVANPAARERLRTLSQAAADDPSPERIRTRLEWLMAHDETVSDELVDVRRTIYSQPTFSESMRGILALQDDAIRDRNVITDDELAAIKHSTLVVWTSDDPSGPAAAGLEMAKKIENGRFQLINDAGHWPQWEQFDEFNDLVLGFLAEPN